MISIKGRDLALTRHSISGLFNPAVTLGLAMIGAITWIRAGLVFIAEMFGAMAAAGIVSALFPGALGVNTTLNRTTSVARGLCKFLFTQHEISS